MNPADLPKPVETDRPTLRATIAAIGFAVPTRVEQRALWDDHFAAWFDAGSTRAPDTGERSLRSSAARRLWLGAGVRHRHGVVDPRREDIASWTTATRLARFAEEAPALGLAAVRSALEDIGATSGRPVELDHLTVVSCTGYATPGPDLRIVEALDLQPETERLFVGHMGCYAALPALRSVAAVVEQRRMTAALCCIELPSLHVQPPTNDPGQLVAHALFGDAAVGAVVTPGGPGLAVVDVAAVTDREHVEDMTWTVTDHGFRMTLSARVPDVLARHVAAFTDRLLARSGLTRADVAGWAVHPGGPRIVEVCGDALGLPPERLEASRTVLADFGNCSSGTVLLVVDRLLRCGGLRDGDHVVALAFGPGLTLYGSLLRRVC